jgi:Short C-terminal domain
MSIDATAVYIYKGSLSDLLSGVRKAIDSMKLVTGNENVTANAFSLVAANKLGFISTRWPGKFIIKAAFANGAANLTVTADLNMFLASQTQVLTNQAKLNEFMDLVKSFAPSPAAGNSGLNDLERLADLRDKGIITPDEFEAKKKQILGL